LDVCAHKQAKSKEWRFVKRDGHGHDHVVALISENLSRRALDHSHPIKGDPLFGPDLAERWVDRLEEESRLIAELLDDEGLSTETAGLLIAFASTAVEMWAMYSGRDALALVESIATRWERDDPQ